MFCSNLLSLRMPIAPHQTLAAAAAAAAAPFLLLSLPGEHSKAPHRELRIAPPSLSRSPSLSLRRVQKADTAAPAAAPRSTSSSTTAAPVMLAIRLLFYRCTRRRRRRAAAPSYCSLCCLPHSSLSLPLSLSLSLSFPPTTACLVQQVGLLY